MITLNLFESNWWDTFKKINLKKSVNKLYFVQNYKKVDKFSFFIFNLFTFQIWENIKAKFLLVKVKNSAISQN